MGGTELPHLEQPRHDACGGRVSPQLCRVSWGLDCAHLHPPRPEPSPGPDTGSTIAALSNGLGLDVSMLARGLTQACSGGGSWLGCPDWVRGQELAVTLGRLGGSLPRHSASFLLFLADPGHPPWVVEKHPCFRKPNRERRALQPHTLSLSLPLTQPSPSYQLCTNSHRIRCSTPFPK